MNLTPWAILATPAVIAGILIYPRHHTTALLSVLLLVATWSVIGRGSTDSRRLATFGVAFLLIMATGPAWMSERRGLHDRTGGRVQARHRGDAAAPHRARSRAGATPRKPVEHLRECRTQ
jgi:hypothetical protein